MRKITITALLIALCLQILTGCSTPNEGTTINDVQHLQTNEQVTYLDPLLSLDKEYTFSFPISNQATTKINQNGYTLESIFSVYVDVELTQKIDVEYAMRNGTIYISPSNDAKAFMYDDTSYTFSNEKQWGLYHHYYIVQSFDLDTGNTLDRPLVTLFTVDAPIDTPNIEISYEDDYSFTVSWENIEDANEYYLMRIDFNHTGDSEAHIISSTKHNTWNSKIDGQHISDVDAALFKSYSVSKDEQYDMDIEYWWEDESVFSLGSIFGVVARNDTNFSNISYFDTQQYNRDQMVCQAATFASNELDFTPYIENIEQIPYQLPATSCSGETIYANVVLNIDQATINDEVLQVPYVLGNASMENLFTISTYNDQTYINDLEQQMKTMHDSYQSEEIYRYESTKVVPFTIKRSNTLPNIQDTIFSTSPLENFIAANMIEGAAMIDISDFEETEDSTFIYDLIEQIRTQNPLILSALSYFYNRQNNIIYIHYLYDNETRIQSQQTIRDEVVRISNQIFTDDMSDVEKVYAINQYISDNTVYNYDAADSIDSYRMHEDYYYTNTAEGVFIHGNALCGGYAAAFMLLADAAGLQSITVTGYTFEEPDIRHAWNRVLIDSQWYVVDVTHNDVDETPNSVLLLADSTADAIYMEDEYFVLDDHLNNYKATGDDIYEYYRHHNLYTTINDAPATLSNQLQNNNQATVRVPLDTTQSQLDQIAQDVVNNIQQSIRYYYLNGVLTIYKT